MERRQIPQTMNITGTHINYYRICKRKLWLFSNGINMEQTSDLVADGKLIEDETYLQRPERYEQIELSVDFEGLNLVGKIDFFDVKNKIIHETKRSNKVEQAHIWQVKFYLWLMKLKSIEAKKGVIEYPSLRQKEEVILTEDDFLYLENTVLEIKKLKEDETCPPVINAKICKSCSYYEFCYVNE
ncbi:CRISPR-associated protein Cas4 [Amniculibacterium sp. G2-70]|uniref:CRISPR-associated protein Cas4 n=1 Tax=Amniculibacterium sp. G2-70 TaxID=2767188 RepID=UPI0021CC8809|nr:CRISPR-associated protein Cas4 [Amniculibacterium sp. G2-70]